MMTKTFCSMALVAALIPFVQPASAQNYKGTPKPTIRDYGPFPKNTKSIDASTNAASGMCGNPAGSCLFYGGDFVDNPLSSSVANGLANENTSLVSGSTYGAATWVGFRVPAGETWNVRGLFTNNLASYGVLDQSPLVPEKAAFWSINEGIVPGGGGTVVASGTSAATVTPTGRAAFASIEYTVQVKGLSITLTPGSYWMAVVPLCTNTSDPYCEGVFFLSDVEYINTRPTNAFGPAESDASFFDSVVFGVTFEPANGPLGACAGFGCDAFSAGVLGSK